MPDPPGSLGGASGRGRREATPTLGRYSEREIPQGLEEMSVGSHMINQWRMESFRLNVVYDPDGYVQRINLRRDADGAAKTLRPLAATENTLLELIDQGWDGLEEMD